MTNNVIVVKNCTAAQAAYRTLRAADYIRDTKSNLWIGPSIDRDDAGKYNAAIAKFLAARVMFEI